MFIDFCIVCAIVSVSAFIGLKIAECVQKIAHALERTHG